MKYRKILIIRLLNHYKIEVAENRRWQSGYLSQTFLVSGQVPSYSSLDAQLSYHIPVIRSLVKIGATNLLNRYYNSFLGGPSTGGMYYVSIGYGIK